jgi:hypothetical protein
MLGACKNVVKYLQIAQRAGGASAATNIALALSALDNVIKQAEDEPEVCIDEGQCQDCAEV